MSPARQWRGVVAMVVTLALPGCAKPGATTAAKSEPFTIEKVAGTDLSRLRLEAKAAERIGIKTEKLAVLHRFGADTERTVVPYSALLYDTRGATSVYTSPEPLVFIRQAVTVDYIEGDLAVLLDSPPPGTPVVTAGGAELAGSEFGVGK